MQCTYGKVCGKVYGEQTRTRSRAQMPDIQGTFIQGTASILGGDRGTDFPTDFPMKRGMQREETWELRLWWSGHKRRRGALALAAPLCLVLVLAPAAVLSGSPSPGLRGGDSCSGREAGGLLELALDPWTPAAFLGNASDGFAADSRSRGSAAATFARFETGILHIPRLDGGHFASLELSSRNLIAKLDRSVSLEPDSAGARTLVHGPSKDFQLVKRVKHSDGEWWSGSVPASAMSTAEVVARLRKGFTLIFNSVDCRFPALARLAEGLEEELGYVVQMNAYLSPKHSQGFEVHWDPMETLVLQLEGNKTWSIYDPIIHLPRPAQRYKPPAADIDMSSRRVVKLTPGSTLYLPRGWLHEATTNASSPTVLENIGSSDLLRLARGQGSASLHLTVGIEAQHATWAQVLHAAVTILVEDSLLPPASGILVHLALCDAALELVVLRTSLLSSSSGASCPSIFAAVSELPGGLGLAAAKRALHADGLAPSTSVSSLWSQLPLTRSVDDTDEAEEEMAGWRGRKGRRRRGEEDEEDTPVEHVASYIAEKGDAALAMTMSSARAIVLEGGRARCQEAVEAVRR